jgi:hypothetical protein
MMKHFLPQESSIPTKRSEKEKYISDLARLSEAAEKQCMAFIHQKQKEELDTRRKNGHTVRKRQMAPKVTACERFLRDQNLPKVQS